MPTPSPSRPPSATTPTWSIIPNSGNVFGENTFVVKLDCNNKVDELDELNNEGQLKYNFLQGGVLDSSRPRNSPSCPPRPCTW